MKYKVLVLGLQARRKTPYKSGDIIDQSALHEGSEGKLIEGGYIEVYKGEQEPEMVKAQPDTRQPEITSSEGKKEFSEITVKEIKTYLDEIQVAYNPLAKKRDLYEMYLEN